MRISDWSSDVCSSDLRTLKFSGSTCPIKSKSTKLSFIGVTSVFARAAIYLANSSSRPGVSTTRKSSPGVSASTCSCSRSEEHTSELQSLMRISYAVFCMKKKNNRHPKQQHIIQQESRVENHHAR